MTSPETAITNLLYRYAEHMDAGRLEDAAALFRHATVRTGGGTTTDEAGLLAQWRAVVKLHPDGTPRTKHVITNPIVEVDEEAGRATCRSYYTVLQATPALPLQVIASGRYHDELERVDGTWRFAARDYSMLDLVGDTGEHLTLAVAGGASAFSSADHAEVSAVVNRYAYALDDREWDRLDEVFAEDAVARYGHPSRPLIEGRVALVDSIKAMLGGCGPSQHLLATHVITVDGDSAVSTCKARVYHHGAGERAALEPYECFGVYRHLLRRTSAGWRITDLLFHVHHTVGDINVLQPSAEA